MLSSHREVLLLHDHRLPLDPHQVHGRALHHLRIHSLENSFRWTSIPKFPAFVDLLHGQSTLNKIFVSCSTFTSFVCFDNKFLSIWWSVCQLSVSLWNTSQIFQERKTKHEAITKTISISNRVGTQIESMIQVSEINICAALSRRNFYQYKVA